MTILAAECGMIEEKLQLPVESSRCKPGKQVQSAQHGRLCHRIDIAEKRVDNNQI
jgi:hypothetical protein